MSSYSEDFCQGEKDCRAEKIRQGGMSEAYYDGYDSHLNAVQLLADYAINKPIYSGLRA